MKRVSACVLLLVVCRLSPALAAEVESYRLPPPPLAEIVDAPPTPRVELSPDRSWLLLLEYPALLSIEDLSRPELRLAGLRFSPITNGPSRSLPVTGMRLLRIADGTTRAIAGLPENLSAGDVAWSPDGAHVAFTVTSGGAIEPWVAEVATARARRLAAVRLNAAVTTPLRWLPSGKALLASLVPTDRGPEPRPPAVPSGPVVRESTGEAAPARTYQDLLANAHDAALFEHYAAARLARIDLDGAVKPLGGPELLWSYDPSPDGSLVCVETVHRPFSYLVPAWRFPRTIEVRDREGRLVHRLADLPLQENVPIAFGSVPTGPRATGWRADAPAMLHWVEAQDGGDARADAEVRDRLYLLAAPFDGKPAVLAELGLRYAGVRWGDGDLAIVQERWWKTRRERAWIVRPDPPEQQPRLLLDRSWEDRYGDPGDAVTVANDAGRDVLFRPAPGTLLLIGNGASPEGDRPFLDRIDLASHDTERLFRSEAPWYERPIAPLDADGRRFLTRRESPDNPPDYHERDLRTGELRPLTDFPHPTPQLAGLSKQLIHYEREDGVGLHATLYLPPGHDPAEDGPLPLLVWAYPQEFKSADAAGQVTDSPYRFDRIRWSSPLLFLTQGYAVLDDPTMPIVGEDEEEPNDRYVEQLVASARAAVDEAVRRGIAEPGRIAIGGHSYGAFMAANLLAHSDLFRAGIARSGAYNRTLTPFGFQAEERTLWEATDVYVRMSPFMHAPKVDEPILLIHGEADNNSGTFPMQSERFFEALKGLGARARLVMLPAESHGYRARESVLHMLWEMTAWLDRFVKNAPAREQLGAMRRDGPEGGESAVARP